MHTDLSYALTALGSSSPSVSGVTLGGVSLTLANSKVYNPGGSNYASYIYYLLGIASGQTAVVVSGTNLSVTSSNGGVDIYEVAGMATASALDKAPTGAGGTGSAYFSNNTGTLSQASEIVFGTCDGETPGAASGWTNITGSGRASGYQIVSATTGIEYTGTLPSGGGYSGCVASFKAGSALAKSGAFMNFLM